MACYTAHIDVLEPVNAGATSWFVGRVRMSQMALIVDQPSGY